MKVVGFTISLLLLILLIFCVHGNVYAHKFYNNQASILFTFAKRYEVEVNLSSDKVPANKSLPLQHSKNADNLFKQLVTLSKDVTNSSELVNNYNNLFSGLNLTTKALVAANLADETLKQYGLAKGLDSNASSSLLNMSMDMIMKMNSLRTKNVTAHNSGISAEPISPIPANNQSSRDVLNPTDNSITNQANFESSASLAKSLNLLFSNNLENAVLENSTGLMPIPMIMKTQSVKELGQGINNLILALNRHAPLEEVSSIVHGQIHPNLFLAFNLKLKGE
jgi:hypothetical protein